MNEAGQTNTEAAIRSTRASSEFYSIPQLSYDLEALQPVLSGEAVHIHYNKHATGYFKKTNELVIGSGLEGLSLEELVKRSEGKLFNNAAQAWNHVFFFSCLAPANSKSIGPKLETALTENFGSVDEFWNEFSRQAVDVFGTGWAWLVVNSDGKLSIDTREDAGTPIVDNLKPLLTCDVWEHAYYLDYRNERDTYLKEFRKIVNWEFVEEQMGERLLV